MRTLNVEPNEKFKLPFIGKGVFPLLMSAGLKYDRKTKAFFIDSGTDLNAVNGILSSRGIKLVIRRTCAICGTPVKCEKCDFLSSCDQKQFFCICKSCLNSEHVFLNYLESQKRSLLSKVMK
ncbi:hypothetical protein DRN86_00355 [Candidatus Geothermarchaeota archaeon]|nr:MAG: hypothetical protein DRN86_00355 [Candidatus Geothermarchaeota archaeon]